MPDLEALYHAYIDCLNRQDWDELGQYVDDDVEHNGRPLKLSGYRGMLEQDFEAIPDLRFNIQLLATTPPLIAARLAFRCSPKALFLGLKVNGRTVSFAENVFYQFKLSKIASVWSVVDRAAIEAQLAGQLAPPGTRD
jgi:predicted ester cyclase